MKKTSGLGFAVWINWIFFVVFLALAAGSVWAIMRQEGISQNTEILAIAIVLLVTLIPAVVFLNNAILFGKISKENLVTSKSASQQASVSASQAAEENFKNIKY